MENKEQAALVRMECLRLAQVLIIHSTPPQERNEEDLAKQTMIVAKKYYNHVFNL